MSFFPIVAGAGAVWALGSYTYDLKTKANMPVEMEADPMVEKPFWGGVGHVSTYAGVLTDRGTFKSVQESVDQKGARIFLVDYGNGSHVVQYYDPRMLL